MKSILLASSLLFSTALLANNIPLDQQVGEFTITEVSSMSFKNRMNGPVGGEPTPPTNPIPVPLPVPGPGPSEPGQKPTFDDRVNSGGRVIQVARDMVALGEAIYEIVKKGRPTNVTEYAPISVVPRDPMSKEYIDPFDMEGFSFPVEKSYVASIKDKTGKEAVKFNYKVIYSYGGSYNGTGKWLTNVIIVPGSVTTRYGWDFNATMKLSGIMNHGSKADPVAGVMVTIKYQMNTWSAAYERNDTIHLTGRGELKTFMSR